MTLNPLQHSSAVPSGALACLGGSCPISQHFFTWSAASSSCACAGDAWSSSSSTSSASWNAPSSKDWTCGLRHADAEPDAGSTLSSKRHDVSNCNCSLKSRRGLGRANARLSGCCSPIECGRPPAACQRRSSAAGQGEFPPYPGSWPSHCQ